MTHSGQALMVGSVGDRLLWAVTLPLLLLLLLLTDLVWTDFGSNDCSGLPPGPARCGECVHTICGGGGH